MSHTHPTLEDRFDLAKSPVFLTGPQAILRLVLLQSEADRRAGLNTAGYVSGYRGSPVGTVDNQFLAAEALLTPRNIKFEAGLNEDLAATALWGSQQAEMRGEGRFDGVFGLWYGKGPGVDRSGDVLRHANMAGTSQHGGVVAIAGDDHSGESSTVIHASDVALSDAMIPVLAPAGVQEIVDLGLMGFALSRYAGVWVGLKCVHDTVESAAVVEAAPGRVAPALPAGHALPPDGLNIRATDDRFAQEERLHAQKMPAVMAFARANHLNRIVFAGGKAARLGIVASGKCYLDVRQALDDLGIDEARAATLGLRLLKVGLVWPLEPQIVREFAEGLDTIIVVEEKRSFIEAQLRDLLYTEKTRPAVIGKRDEKGGELFAAYGVIDPNRIAVALAARLKDKAASACAAALQAGLPAARNRAELASRIPYFCAGCPHNSSTVLPEGARGYAGIGCHWLVQFVPGRATQGATQMGGEGANWVGEAPFSTRAHVFQNMGDGTYNHSGLMAIRHAVKSGVNITYKILFNDAVAMTGGQRNDGGLTVFDIANQVRANGVQRIAVVSDEPEKYPSRAAFPPQVSIHHRSELQALQREFEKSPGTSVIIYDQTCAAEKRRRRRVGQFPDPKRRVVINADVCEGCGDCGVQSNCVAIMPLETPLGRKRQIDQSACNKDFSCLKGFCPSFVTIEGGELAKGAAPRSDPARLPFPELPEPRLPDLARPWNILIAGIGGTGVVTIGHLLGQAAHIEGKGAALIDMVGISQKNGAVVTHLKLAAAPAQILAVRVADGSADLILGCDLVTAASDRILAGAARSRSHAVVNVTDIMPAQFTNDADYRLPNADLSLRVESAVMAGGFHAIEATAIATRLMGDSIAANLFLLGFAWQKGLVPLAAASIAQAVRLNGVSVAMNLAAFLWGRRAAVDLTAVTAVLDGPEKPVARSAAEIVAERVHQLTDYQDAAYAETYRRFVQGLAGPEVFRAAVARNLAKLMAYKDEYEVARLLASDSFAAEIAKRFTGGYRLRFHLAPPLLGRRDANGVPLKSSFGPGFVTVFRLLAKLKRLRGTAFDPFGHTAERKRERQLIADYRALIIHLAPRVTAANLDAAVALAELPEQIRGFGHVKAASLAKAEARQADLLRQFEDAPQRQAAE